MGTFGQTIRLWDSTPMRERVQARESRAAALARVQPKVAALLDEPTDAAKVAERIIADQALTPLDRRTALQVMLRRGLESKGK